MEIKFFIKKLLDFYIRFTDEFSIEIELNAFEEYKKEFSLIKKDFNKLSFDKEKFGKEIFDIHNFDKEKFDEENLIIDVNLMLQKIEYIFSGHMNVELIKQYLEDNNNLSYEESDFDELSFGDMVTSGMYSQIDEYLFDSSGVRMEEVYNPEDELNEPSRHEK